ncbi:coil containing protein [Vibrio phage 1.076.O._10N.286.51.B7]|nr:coil containing protein [Vibrio phage 1.076.O._10N.286.51.B7]
MNNELDQASIRTWLKQMPDAGVFKDDVWLACDRCGDWFVYEEDPSLRATVWDTLSGEYLELHNDFFNLPTLEGDQWKYSCISVIELAEWQMEQVK